MANCIPGPNLCFLLVGLYVERESVWLAIEGHHLVHGSDHRLLRRHGSSRRIRTDSQIVRESPTSYRYERRRIVGRDVGKPLVAAVKVRALYLVR